MISTSARRFMERIGVAPVLRMPVPRYDGRRAVVENYPLNAQLPRADLVLDANGNPAPDRSTLREFPPSQST